MSESSHETQRSSGLLLAILFVAIALTIVGASYYFYVKSHTSRPAKVALANMGMRNVAAALESYYIEWNTYPLPAEAESWSVIPSVTEPVAGYTPASLTTPIVYTSAIPMDLFRTGTIYSGKPGSFAYRYGTWPLSCWILASDGPDGDADIPLVEFFSDEVGCDPKKFFTHFGGKWPVYDPSNGATSNGDVLIYGP